MHQKTASNSAASARTRRIGPSVVTTAHSSTPSSTIYASRAAGFSRNPCRNDHHSQASFWPNAMDLGKDGGGKRQRGEKSGGKNGWMEGRRGNHRVHLHTLYITLCVVLLNLVVLLCLIHFKLLLIVPSVSSENESEENATNSSSAAINGQNATLAKRMEEERGETRMKGELLENGKGESANSSSSAKDGPSSLELVIKPAEISRPIGAAAQGVRMDEKRRRLDRMRTNMGEGGETIGVKNESPSEQRGEMAELRRPENGEATARDIVWEMPLKKVGLRLLKEPIGRASDEGVGCHPCPSAHQPVQPVLAFHHQKSSTPPDQYLVDCRNEEDSQGSGKCMEWSRAGFCQSHPATKWLFCRKQCLCSSSMG